MGVQIVKDAIHALVPHCDAGIDLHQEIHPIGDRAPSIGLRERLTSGRLERAKDRALAPAPIIRFLLRPLSGWIAGNHLRTPKAPGALRAHLVQTNHEAVYGRVRIEDDDGPLFSANAGSTRSPNHVS